MEQFYVDIIKDHEICVLSPTISVLLSVCGYGVWFGMGFVGSILWQFGGNMDMSHPLFIVNP